MFLGILGTIAVAAWWTGLDKHAFQHVTQLFTTQIQAVQDSINKLNVQADDLRAKVAAIEEMIPELQHKINIAQDSAMRAHEETESPNLKQLRAHNQHMQKTTDQQGRSSGARQFIH